MSFLDIKNLADANNGYGYSNGCVPEAVGCVPTMGNGEPNSFGVGLARNASLGTNIPLAGPIELESAAVPIQEVQFEGVRSTGYRLPSTFRRAANGLCYAGASLAFSTANHIIGNILFGGSKALASGPALFANYMGSSAMSSFLKGIIMHVGSWREQLIILTALPALSVLMDCGMGYAFGTPGLISTAAYIAPMIAASMLCKIACYVLTGRNSFYTSEANSENQKLNTWQNYLKLGLTAIGACGATAFMGQYVNQAINYIFYSLFSNIYRKIGKSVIKIGESTQERLTAIVCLFGIAMMSGLIAGVSKPFDTADCEKTLTCFMEVLLHYFGPVTGIAFVGLLADQLVRVIAAFRKEAKKKEKVKGDKSKTDESKKDTFLGKYIKPIAHSGVFLAETIGAVAANALNCRWFNGSKTVSLGIKLFQQGWTFHTERAATKKLEGVSLAATLGATGVISIVPSIVAGSVFKVCQASASAAVSLGSVMSIATKRIRNWILPKPPEKAHKKTKFEQKASSNQSTPPSREPVEPVSDRNASSNEPIEQEMISLNRNETFEPAFAV